MITECKDCSETRDCQRKKAGAIACEYSIQKSNTIQPVEPLYRVRVKYSKDKDAVIMIFDAPVHVYYNLLQSHVSVLDEDGTMLYLTHYNLIDYIQVLPVSDTSTDLLSKGDAK